MTNVMRAHDEARFLLEIYIIVGNNVVGVQNCGLGSRFKVVNLSRDQGVWFKFLQNSFFCTEHLISKPRVDADVYPAVICFCG